jgi:hypothetical protein
MALANVMGFFYQMGSLDFPNNMNLDSKFGFNEGSVSPIFNYNINDVNLSFTDPQKLSRDGFYFTDRMSVLLAEAVANTDLKNENISNQYWIKAFRIIEYLYNNQSTFIQGAVNTQYICVGDEILSSPITPGTTSANPYYIDTYVSRSLRYELSSHAGRVRYVTFQVSFAGGIVSFTIYFDADAFVERSDGVRYQVYRYIDTPPEDSTITQPEFKNSIVNPIFNVLKAGRFNTYADFYTDKRVGESTYVTEQFFVFSSLSTAPNESVQRREVKAYLLSYYNLDTTFLRYTYPSLFDENSVTIIPLYENKLNLAGGSSIDVHAVDIVNIRTVLSQFGFNINEASNQYRPVEIFHLGPGTGYTPSNGSRPRYVYPILAVEVDIESAILRPITTRFQDYVPIYGSLEAGNAATFHSILIAILDYLTGVSSSIDTTLKTEREIVVNAPDAGHYNRRYATFKFMGTLWFVYGPASAI